MCETKIKKPQLFGCFNDNCKYLVRQEFQLSYKKHVRYMWYSQSKLVHPTCPNCKSHKTEKLGIE